MIRVTGKLTNKSIKIFFALLIAILCFILIISIFTGCSKKPSVEDIWKFTQGYIRDQLGIYSEYNLVFPEKYKEYVSQLDKNRYEIKSYIIDYYSGCCGNYKRRDFSMIVDYKNEKYSVLSFNIQD